MKLVSLVLNDFRNDSRVLKMCKTLNKAGIPATVAALHRPGLDERGTTEGVVYHRIKLKTYGLPGKLNFIKLIEMIFKMRKYYRDYDLWIANDYEALVMYYVVKLLGGKSKLLYDSHELQSHRQGRSEWDGKMIRFFERLILKKDTVVFNVSPGIIEYYKKHHKLENQRLVMNVSEPKAKVEREDIFRTRWNIPADSTLFIWQGNLALQRGLEQLIKAFEGLGTEKVLIIMGFGPLEKYVRDKAEVFDNIYFHEAVPHEQIIRYTSAADWGITNIQNTCLNNYHALPNKLFEYIQSRLPVLCNDLADTANLVLSHEIGFTMKGDDIEDIRKVVSKAAAAEKTFYLEKANLAAEKLNWGAQEELIVQSVNEAFNA